MTAVPGPAPRDRIILPARWRRSTFPDPYEMPFTLLVIGDLTGREDPRPIEDRKPIRVTRERFEKVKSEQKLRSGEPPIWDELKRVVEAIDGMPNVEIEILNASHADLFSDFEDSPEIPKSGLYKHLYTANYCGAHPYGAVLFGQAFDLDDRKLLELIAQTAAPAHAPWIIVPTPKLAGSSAFETLRATAEGRYLGTGDLMEAAVKLVQDFVAIGYADEVGGIDPRVLAGSRVAQNLKVLRTIFMGTWRTDAAVEAGINGWLAKLVADPDDGTRPFRVARVRVTGSAQTSWLRELELHLWAHAGAAGKLGPIVLRGWIDME